MADLGAVAIIPAGLIERAAGAGGMAVIRRAPDYALADPTYTPFSVSGVLGGTILEAGVPLALCEVWVFWRPTMRPIARTWTDVNGDWEVGGLDPTKTEHYTVVIKDKGGGTVYNDAIYALVAPV